MVRKSGEDVCGSSKATIDSFALSAAAEEDVEPWAVSSMGCLMMTIRLGAALIELRELTL